MYENYLHNVPKNVTLIFCCYVKFTYVYIMKDRFEMQMDEDLKKKAIKKAEQEGFDSLAAWIRYLLTKNLDK